MLVYVACQHRISQCSPVLSTQDFLNEMSQKDKKVDSLVKMGFPEDEAALAITRCGVISEPFFSMPLYLPKIPQQNKHQFPTFGARATLL